MSTTSIAELEKHRQIIALEYAALAQDLNVNGHPEKAGEIFQKALGLNDQSPDLWVTYGNYLLSRGVDFYNAAMGAFLSAAKCEPDNPNYKIVFVNALKEVCFFAVSQETREFLLECLKANYITKSSIFSSWKSIIGALSQDAPFYTHPLDKMDDLKKMLPVLNDEFVLEGLKNLFMSDLEVEDRIVALRRFILELSANDDNLHALQEAVPFVSALAVQCQFNEFVFDVSDAEDEILGTLLDRAVNNDNALLMALYGCYNGLFELPEDMQNRYLNKEGDDHWYAMLQFCIGNPRQEKNLRSTIESLGSFQNQTTSEVRSQYENNPYPQWISQNLPTIASDYADLSQGVEILNAGCGSGHESLMIGHFHPKANITAIDISLSSLSYAKRKAIEHGYEDRIDFYHCDLLEPQELNKKFDVVYSSGVLHHLDDPKNGFKSLLSVLKPGGMLYVALYSTLSRAAVNAGREYIAQNNIKTDPQGIRQFRAHVKANMDDEVLSRSTSWRDFYLLSECRDMFFHVQEHTYTFPEIISLLDDLGLIIADIVKAPQDFMTYCHKVNAEGKDAHEVAQCLHEWEEKNPDTFKSMYFFSICRKDELMDNQYTKLNAYR